MTIPLATLAYIDAVLFLVLFNAAAHAWEGD